MLGKLVSNFLLNPDSVSCRQSGISWKLSTKLCIEICWLLFLFRFEDLYEAMVDTELTDGKPTKLIEEDFCSGVVVQLGHGPGCPVLG